MLARMLAAALVLLAAAPLDAAQVVGGTLRPYWHVFIAYAVAWLVVLGWVVHIARRLGRLDRGGN